MPRLVQGIDLSAEGAACRDGLGWQPLSHSCRVPAPGAAGRARVPGHYAPRAAPRPPLQAARSAEPPAPRAPSRLARTCPKQDSPPAPPWGAHLPAAPRIGSGSFSGRMGSAGSSGPAPRVGRGPSSSSPRSSSGAGGAGRLGMTRTGQLGRREGGGRRRGRREVGGGPGPGRYNRRGQGPGPRQCEGFVGPRWSRRGAGRAGREERPGGARASGRALTRAVRSSSAPGAGSGPFYAQRPAPRSGASSSANGAAAAARRGAGLSPGGPAQQPRPGSRVGEGREGLGPGRGEGRGWRGRGSEGGRGRGGTRGREEGRRGRSEAPTPTPPAGRHRVTEPGGACPAQDQIPWPGKGKGWA